MKIRFMQGPSTGEVIDVENREYWFAFQKLGLIEFVAAAAPAKKRGVAQWFIHDATSDKSLPTVVARCPECRAEGVFSDPPRVLKPYEGEKDNSPMRRCKLEHCGHTDRIPDSIFEKYYDVLNGIKR